ncbi:MAG TPA: hypothetical protein VI704_07215 [Bacteroidota bacterium]|nr:hypothetical protein [Bacteroidota bacterium]
MRTVLGCAVAILLIVSTSNGQLKSRADQKPSVSESIIRYDNSGLLFGWFDPSRLTMRHSYSLSYSSFAGQNLSLGVYTNSLFYEFSDPLSVQFDVSLMHSPFNSFGPEFSKSFSGLYLSRAQLNYRPTENMWLQVQFRQVPALYWLGNPGYYSPGFFNSIERHEEEKH